MTELYAAYPFLSLVEAHADALLAEAKAVPAALWSPMRGYQTACHGFVLEAGRFAHEFPDADFPAHKARCPTAARLAGAVPGVVLAGFLRMDPGGSMLPHTDPRDDDMVRCHLGLQLPAEEQAWWRPGTARLMDTRQSHWARNPSDYPRYTFVLDVRMPFVVPSGAFGQWRPDDPNVVRPNGNGSRPE